MRGLALILHLATYIAALYTHGYLWNDSVQYLTLADNLANHGLLSQEYAAPFYQDTQRMPLYPLLLFLFQWPWLILLLQHALAGVTAYLLYLIVKPHTRRWALRLGYAYFLMPYTLLFSNILLTEMLYVTLITALVYALSVRSKWSGLWLVLALLTKPITIVLVPVWAVVLVLQRQYKPALIAILAFLPWVWMAHETDRPILSGEGTGTVYGKLGGSLTHYESDRQLIYATQVHLSQDIPIESIHTAQHPVQHHAGFHPKAKAALWQYWLHHPWDAVQMHAVAFYQMWRGVGYQAAVLLYGSTSVTVLSASIQLVYNLLLLASILLALYYWRRLPFAGRLALVISMLLLLAHASAWSDGRYRFIVDGLLLLAGVLAVTTMLKSGSTYG